MDSSLYASEGRLAKLKERTRRCVCKYCGGGLALRQIFFGELDDARIEIFCRSCDRIEYGVEPQIFAAAKGFVEQTGFNHFPDLDNTDAVAPMNVAKVAEIMTWSAQGLGVLSEDGFTVPVRAEGNAMGECLVLSDADIKKLRDREG